MSESEKCYWLIIEDAKALAEAAKMNLEAEWVQDVSIAENLNDAVRKIKELVEWESKKIIIVLDGNFPDISGGGMIADKPNGMEFLKYVNVAQLLNSHRVGIILNSNSENFNEKAMDFVNTHLDIDAVVMKEWLGDLPIKEALDKIKLKNN